MNDQRNELPGQGDEQDEKQERIFDAESALRNAQRLLAENASNQDEPLTIHATHSGMVPLEDTVELMQRLEQLQLSDAEKGDVVWWLTQSGTRGYFAIETPYTNDGTGTVGMKTGRGRFLITRRPGEHLGDQTGEGYIRGASLGSALKLHTVTKGLSVEYTLTGGETPKPYRSTPVTDMGIIKAQTTPQA